MKSQYKDGEMVEYRSVDEGGSPEGGWVKFRYTKNGIRVDRPPSDFCVSNSVREETQPMEMIAPVNPLAQALGQLLPLAVKWLEKELGQVEGVPSISADATAPPLKEWYSPEEASEEINRTPNHVRELCRKRVFGKRDAGGRWIINRKELEAFRLGRLTVHGEKFK